MDYIYSALNARLIDKNSDKEITWTTYDNLPEPTADYYMTVAVIDENNADTIYLCIKRRGKYAWKLICRGSTGQLEAPVITLTGTVLAWNEVANTIGYEIYANAAFVASTTDTQIDIGPLLTSVGTYNIYVFAKAAIGSGYEDSDASNNVTYTVYHRYFKFVHDFELVTIPADAETAPLPIDFKTNGVIVRYITIGEQYEYFAYPASFDPLIDVEQSGQHVLENFIKLENVVKDNVEYHIYRTVLPQVYDDSKYVYHVFRI